MSKLIAMRDPDNPRNVTLIETETIEIQKEIDRIRKKAQYHQECACPKRFIWKCDGDCDHCEYNIRLQSLSLDLEIENHGDHFAETSDIEAIVADKLYFAELLARLAVLIPEAIEVGNLMLEGKSERSSIEQLGLNRSTYRSRIKKFRKQLLEELGEIF